MFKLTRYILLGLILHVSMLCFAQADEYDDDTLITSVEPPLVETTSSFSEITRQQPVETKKLPSEKIDELKKDDDYWYANLEPEKEGRKRRRAASE